MSGPPSKDDTPEQVAAKLKSTLNLGAPTFVPNAKAKEFVPSWLPKPAAAKPVSSTPAKTLSIGSSPAKSVSIGSTPPVPSPVAEKKPSEKAAEEPKSTAAPKAPTETKAQNKNPQSAPKAAVAPVATNEAVIEEIEADDEVTEEFLSEVYKEHVNVIFLGHVDAGKSTMGGNILFLTGMVDKRTMEKYEREAKEAGRESWYLSWALDLNSEERAKGKTVECGRAYFETKTRKYTVLDAPGHKNYVPSMLGGASQADVGVLVISARRGEFETGFERGGQTREHAVLAKTAGVNKLFIAINKMDDPTVNWDKERYDEIVDKLTPFLKGTGFNPKTDLVFLPVSGYTGANLKDRLTPDVCSYYDGPSLLELLDGMKTIERKINAPLMIPIIEKFKDMGTVVIGKIESGHVKKGQNILVMPNSRKVEVTAIWSEEEEVEMAVSGDNIRLRLNGIDEKDIMPGFILCGIKKPVKASRLFEAQLVILETKNIICAGYGAVMHLHSITEEVSLNKLLHLIDKKTGRRSKRPPPFIKKGQKVIVELESTGVICMEPFSEYPQLGRFTLRDEGKTVAIGKITKVIETAP
ncbi:translation termination factor GTPase eRF3 [Entomophthora muscae]|uniref:Translation termination factor GTPase eRF3 n=1 Tax=Entomophthora muscae TaxID=34485 RepID=A0ACC2SMM5_9FUNG|nr:translation termination factor GTPase eRF3 [Entomophthora muscae]